jgi:predicted RNA-binding protein with TRAM domain
MPISELKQQPIKPGEEVIVDVTDMHESGAGVGRTDDGFIVFVDGLLPEARAKVRIDRVLSNHAKANEVVERLPLVDEDGEEIDPDEADSDADGEESDADDGDKPTRDRGTDRENLGSRENFWGG